jgi:Peptidase A4 family
MVARIAAVAACATAAMAASVATAAPAAAAGRSLRAAPNVSGNWAGYVATLPGGSATTKAFRTVSASWVQQPVTCAPGSRSFSAFWVGLGGYYRASQALEQIGTEADCSRRGLPIYNAWYELVPNAPVTLHIPIHAGDSVTARVTVVGRKVGLQLRDVTTGKSYARTLRFSHPDVSSADWITEAPSACDNAGNCASLQLANFGTSTFTAASATAVSGHQGTISDPSWKTTTIELRDIPQGSRFDLSTGAAAASPSPLSTDGSSFAVTWSAAPQVSGPPPQDGPPPGFFPG